jgi:hypothetical protein
MNYADSTGFVYGKVKKTKDGTYHVLYLSPEGYFNPCKSLGEYASGEIAKNKLEQYHEHMTSARLDAKQKSNQGSWFMTNFYTIIIFLTVNLIYCTCLFIY